MKYITTGLLIIFVCIYGLSTGYYMGGLPSENIKAYTARSLAMGNLAMSTDNGSASVFSNAAFLAYNEGINIGFSPTLNYYMEDRSYPAFGFFDGYISDQIYVTNDDMMERLNASISYLYNWGMFSTAIGVGYKPFLAREYHYLEDVRDVTGSDTDGDSNPETPKLGENMIDCDGNYNAYTVGFGITRNNCTVFNRIALGFAVHILDGDLMHKNGIKFSEYSIDKINDENLANRDYMTTTDESYKGTAFHIGLNIQFGDRYSMSLKYMPEYEIESDLKMKNNGSFISSDLEVEGETKMKMPAILSGGFMYRPQDKSAPIIHLEADIYFIDGTAYGDMAATDDELNYEFRGGIEYNFVNHIPFRMGMRYNRLHGNKDIQAMFFTGGSGYDFGMFRADIGFEFGSREYRADDLFPDSDYRYLYADDDVGVDQVAKQLVEEAIFNTVLSFGFKF